MDRVLKSGWITSQWVLGLLIAAAPLAAAVDASAQTTGRLWRIGTVSPYPSEAAFRRADPPLWKALVESLREQGFVEGRDYHFERRYGGGSPERLEHLTKDLVAAQVDLLVIPVCGAPLDAARKATQTIPIVVPTCNDDLVDLGIVKSFGRPGGSITGLSKLTPELAPKRLQLLLDAVPNARRIAVLWNPGYSNFKADWRELRGAAQKLGVTLLPVEFRSVDAIEPAFESIARQRVDALMTFSDILVYVNAQHVGQLARRYRLPAVFPSRELSDGGGLMSYGPSIPGMWRQSGRLIAHILKGEKAADIPIEQPTRLELIINQTAAKELGLNLPQVLLLQATQVID